MNKKVIFTVCVAAFCITVLGDTGSSHATSTYQNQMNQAENQKSSLENKQKEMQDKIDSLEQDKGDVVSYIGKLDKQVNDLNGEIDSLEDKMNQKNTDLAKTQSDLQTAKETENNQYETMKKRIKYMYENGSTEYLDIIFSAKDMSELLNRTEYISKISDYDRTILQKYQATKQSIAEKEKRIEEDIASLNDMKQDVEVRQGTVKKMMDNKNTELKKCNQNIVSSKEKADEFAQAVAKQEQVIDNLLQQERLRIIAEQKKKEEAEKAAKAAQAAQAAKNSSTTNTADTNSSNSDNYSSQNGTASLRWPLKVSGTITSTFGSRTSPTAGASTNHQGIDIGVPAGTPIVASGAGSVVTASYQTAAGNYIMIYHGGTEFTVYMHCSKLAVSVGQTVKQGDIIGYVGATGVATGPHLHFGVSLNGKYVNPLSYVKR